MCYVYVVVWTARVTARKQRTRVLEPERCVPALALALTVALTLTLALTLALTMRGYDG